MSDAGIVDQDVDAAKGLHGGVGHGFDADRLSATSTVVGECSVAAQFRRAGDGRIGVDVGNHDPGALGDEFLDDTGAEIPMRRLLRSRICLQAS